MLCNRAENALIAKSGNESSFRLPLPAMTVHVSAGMFSLGAGTLPISFVVIPPSVMVSFPMFASFVPV